MLGGIHDDARNFVTMWHRGLNNTSFKTAELAVRRAALNGDIISLTVIPLYRGANAMPYAISMRARNMNTMELIVDQVFDNLPGHVR